MATGPPDRSLEHLKVDIHRRVVESLDLRQLDRLGGDHLRRVARDKATRFVREADHLLSEVRREQLIESVLDEIFGIGPIERYMSDPTISDILVNGPDQVFIERNGKLEKTATVFADDAHVLNVIQRIVSRVGRRIDEPRRWSTPGSPTARGSTPSSRRWPSTARWSPSGCSAPSRSARTTCSGSRRSPPRCSPCSKGR